MEPLISICFVERRRDYHPGETLRVAYQVDAPDAAGLAAVEASVLWNTVGKGDEDMAVHVFERRQAADLADGDLRQQWELETALPNSPLSYDGVIVKLVWCIRVRVFLDRGKEVSRDLTFRLGRVPRARRIASPDVEQEAKPADAENDEQKSE